MSDTQALPYRPLSRLVPAALWRRRSAVGRAVLEAPEEAGPRPSASDRPRVRGKFIFVGGEKLLVKGVTYGTFRPNEEGEPYPPLPQVKRDFQQMREAGINTVRFYTPPSNRIADAAAEAGLFIIPEICWGPRRCELDDPERVKFIFQWVREHAKRLARHPAVLMYSIGNEIPPLLVRWYGRERIEQFLRDIAEAVREEAPGTLLTYVNHPPTEYLHLPFIDVLSFNIYLEREPEFRAYLARLQSLSGDKPLMLAELGLDAHRNGDRAQARFMDWQLRAAFEKGLAGAVIFSWTDEWGIFGTEIVGWSFGLTRGDRSPRVALRFVSRIFHSSLTRLRPGVKPMVSVVVCCYNAAKTLEECLRSLAKLRYPNYEIIGIDDGSSDHSHKIMEQFGVRRIQVPNGGLSLARNLGIEAARGEIIAFIDSDAYADPDWLYYLVTAMEEKEAVAAGGPNLSPPEDGFTSQCVDHAPGNPTHVLTDDELAEHVPGCNMAFRKDALKEIGMFDPTHRAAGDDVDVCWKLLVRRKKIAFSPTAVVWHHRRSSIRTFLRQQRGYGFAEAHLANRYPGRYNFFGYAVWRGGIYDGVHAGLRREGVPLLFGPSRVYQGQFGSAQFQSIYQPFQTWWFQIFTTVEWQALTLAATLSGALVLPHGKWMALAPLLVAVLMLAALIGAAVTAGLHAARLRNWRGWQRTGGILTVAFLHFAQPLARARGRISGWFSARKERIEYPAVQRLWGNLEKREEWLNRLLEHLRDCGWVANPACEFSSGDLEVSGPGPCRVEITSLYEEQLEKNYYFVRFRLTARYKPGAWAVMAALAVPLGLACFHWWSLPLALPAAFFLWRHLKARQDMTRAVSQLALEVAEACAMPRVDSKWGC
ncbi:MAG: glycosyltransferase [Verrucomicrobia bacterium]|nr:glycosyltransferase [Verrucomicrobiota bacterium]